MIDFILAGALGAIALIVYLLFRRLRRLSWQLTQLRVERDCERILQDIGLAGSRPVTTAQPATAHPATEPPAVPVRRKRHLRLYQGLGGMSAAFVRMQDASRRRRPALITSGAATAVVASLATLILVHGLTPDQRAPKSPGTRPAVPTSRPAGHDPASSWEPGGQSDGSLVAHSARGAPKSARHVAMPDRGLPSSSDSPAADNAGVDSRPGPGNSPPATAPPTTSAPPGPPSSTSAPPTATPLLCAHVGTVGDVGVCIN